MLNRILTVGFMADGYPIDGKPKEKTEKMHSEIWKRWIAFIAIVAIVAVVAYFAFVAQTPVKTATDPPEVKTAVVQQAENAAVNIATGAAVTIPADALKIIKGRMDWQKPFPINNAPRNILIEDGYNLIKDLQIGPTQISGHWINTHPQAAQAAVGGRLTIYFFKGNELLDTVSMKVYDATSNEAFATVERPAKTFGADGINFMAE